MANDSTDSDEFMRNLIRIPKKNVRFQNNRQNFIFIMIVEF